MSGLILVQSNPPTCSRWDRAIFAELQHVRAAGEQATVDVGEVGAVRPAREFGRCPVLALGVHGLEQRAEITSCVLDESLALICSTVSVNLPLPRRCPYPRQRSRKSAVP